MVKTSHGTFQGSGLEVVIKIFWKETKVIIGRNLEKGSFYLNNQMLKIYKNVLGDY